MAGEQPQGPSSAAPTLCDFTGESPGSPTGDTGVGVKGRAQGCPPGTPLERPRRCHLADSLAGGGQAPHRAVRPECHAAPLRTRVLSCFRSCSHSRGPDHVCPQGGARERSASRGRGLSASVGLRGCGNSSGLLRVVSPAGGQEQVQGTREEA